MALSYFWIFIFLMAAGMPVVFALLVGPGLSLAFEGDQVFFKALLSRLYSGMDSFPLMALPFFILAGQLMNSGGITRSIVDFSQSMIGHVRGGLAQVNILSSVLFAGLSGSAVADTSALGIMILYAFIMNVSVAGLFAAGLVPGLMVSVGLMLVTSFISKKRNYPVAGRKATWRERGQAFRRTALALLTPVILLGGILAGIFTPTEAAAVAAFYALVVTLFLTRTLRIKELPSIFIESAVQSGVILFLVGASVVFAWIITVSGLAGLVASGMMQTSDNVYILLFLANLFLFVVGMFLDAGPAVLILGPILGPLFVAMGVDPIHFAVVMCVNVTVGLATPPMGLVLFVAASVSKERVETIARQMLPFLAVEITVIFLITYFPALSMTLPRLLGFA
jgi:TRAP-type C4-dicarboxylate transport system permease large subunit